MIRYPLSSFTRTYQSKVIDPGKREVVWRYVVPANYYLFVEKIYIFWIPGFKNYLYIDNVLEKELNYQVGSPEAPERYDPPILVKGELRIETYNGSGRKMMGEALIDGYLVPLV